MSNSKGLKKEEYNVIIVGAGIGGLACGCYLARAGKKVLIIEKNHQVGGYCTSFKRNGVLFDACAYSISSCKENGIIDDILNDLNLKNKISFKRSNPRRVIISDDKRIEIGDSSLETIQNLCKHYPSERINIQELFKVILSSGYLKIFTRMRTTSFTKFLKMFNIKNQELINFFSFLFLESSGLPSSNISVFMGTILLKEYILDGGYYPQGGMQSFSNNLALKFQKLGGEILLNTEAKKIIIFRNKAVGVQISDNQSFWSSAVVSNVDLRYTLSQLIPAMANKCYLNELSHLKASLSSLILYLKLNKKINVSPYTRFVSLKENIEQLYGSIIKGDFKKVYPDCFINNFNASPCAVVISLLAPFKTEKFWNDNKSTLIKKLMDCFTNKLNLHSSDISLMDVATPYTLRRWTNNHNGANFGWAPLTSQIFSNFRLKINIQKLYFVGHWIGKGHGVSTVAYLGKQLAQTMLAKRHE